MINVEPLKELDPRQAHGWSDAIGGAIGPKVVAQLGQRWPSADLADDGREQIGR